MTTVQTLFDWVAHATLPTALVILMVLAIQAALGRRLSARVRYALWGLVLVRALLPTLPASPWSVFTFAPEIPSPVVELPESFLPPVVVHVNPEQASKPASTSTPVPAPARALPVLPLIWLGGCVTLIAGVVVSSLRLSRRLRRATPVTDSRTLDLVESCRRELGMRAKAPNVILLPDLPGPALAGVWRPRILLPAGLIERLDDAELRFVLLHELVHLQRRDLLVEWILVFTRAIHWFNPLMWIAVSRCRADRELACDEQILRRCVSLDHRSYGQTILKLAQNLTRAATPIGAVGMLPGQAQLKRRIRMIARFNPAGKRWPAVVALLGGLTLASCTLNDRKPVTDGSNASDEFGRVTRAYDVRDIVIEIPDFTEAPTFGVAPKETQETPPPPLARTKEQMLALVAKLVKETVAPEKWDQPGGGVLRESQSQFIITATPRTHEQVKVLLSQLRQAREVQITVEARFIAVGDEAMAEMKNNPVLFGILDGDVLSPDGVPSPTFLTKENCRNLLLHVQALRDTTMVTAPRLTVFSGQRAYVIVATQRAYVADYTIVKGPNGETSYDPQLEVANSGVVFDVTAAASVDRKYATLTLRPQLSHLESMDEVPFHNAPLGSDMKVQRPNVQTSGLNTTVSVPDGETILIRGLRGPISLHDKAGDARLANILVLVKPKIIIQGVSEPATMLTAPPPPELETGEEELHLKVAPTPSLSTP